MKSYAKLPAKKAMFFVQTFAYATKIMESLQLCFLRFISVWLTTKKTINNHHIV